MRRLYGAAAAGVLALALGACGNKAETAAAEAAVRPRTGPSATCGSWRRRTPAAAGTRPRARCRTRSARRRLVDKGAEVHNVPGAGGTIGLAQLATKHAGNSNQLMVMGLVMVGAIQTNKSPVDLSKTTPIASLTTRARGDRGAAEVEVQDARAAGRRHQGRPGQVLVGRRLGRRHGPDPRRPARQGGGRDPSEAQVRRLLGRRRGQGRRSSPAASTPASRASASSPTRSRPARCARSPSRAPKPVEVGGKPAKTIKEPGYDVEMTNWRGVVGAARTSTPAERDAAIVALVEKLHASPEWQDAIEADTAGRLLQDRRRVRRRYLDSRERAACQGAVLGEHRAAPAMQRRRPGAGPAAARGSSPAGRVASRSLLRASFAIPRRAAAGPPSGPRFVPLIVAIGLIVLSLAFLARTWRAARHRARRERSAEEAAATHWATPGAARRSR